MFASTKVRVECDAALGFNARARLEKLIISAKSVDLSSDKPKNNYTTLCQTDIFIFMCSEASDAKAAKKAKKEKAAAAKANAEETKE